MASFLELQKDKSFRLKLISICLILALSVSIVYVVVSYRLAADLGIKTELESLHKQAMLIHSELIINDKNRVAATSLSNVTALESKALKDKVSDLVNRVYFNDHSHTDELYLKITGPRLNLAISHQFSPVQIETLTTMLSLSLENMPLSAMQNGVKKVGETQFIWYIVDESDYQVLLVKTARSLDDTLDFVMKRLTITSVIVFWLATWFALTLSSWMNKRVQDKNDALAHLATHDSLTGLPNRLFLADLMRLSITDHSQSEQRKPAKLKSTPVKEGCLFVIDLDKFKEVNDAFGHAAGDFLLISVAQKLNDILAPSQTLIRTGGDEFIIWAPEMSAKEAETLAAQLVIVCNEPITINDFFINTGASVGFSHYPSHAQDAESLIIYADMAMYEAKQKRCGWSMFSEVSPNNGQQRLKLRADLDNALSQKQIKLYYQPKVMLQNGQVIGVEALARWYHPTDGQLSPAYFVDLIEQGGRVQEFGRYIILAAIEQMAVWQQQGILTPVAINLSPFNLLDPELLSFTLTSLEQHKVAPSQLEIELIESATSVNIDYIASKLTDFRNAGIKLAIDDFGTGMSSLSYLSNLNVNHIKIDRSFIDNLEHDPKKRAIVSTAIALAEPLNCQVIAEGIETKAQVDILIKMGCFCGQGYYFAKPMDVKDIEAVLLENTTLPFS
ncbi:EAL domain-containing protein [Marinomonas hwangdonensis]|uniref:EAL domain-containing protein n=1 Tax=Marinomonas hwangdonensis TaxID=1053647 RepID=A0A3M8Q5K8_9GAMM|nr:EAL domain-containing protein [Marinomonas hwangdonensis]RNF51416.1 EAL domain-containing protein [Marinomonas hwangdonensis]